MQHSPLILITNDDGIHSPGLHATVMACATLGELLIVAPAKQQSAVGRSKPPGSSGCVHLHKIKTGTGVQAQTITGYAIECSPAQTVEYAVLELAKRPIQLVVSGINFGANIGEGITVSGTVGAAMEAASFGIPAIAVSLQTDPKHFYVHHDEKLDQAHKGEQQQEVDFTVAGHFVNHFARAVLQHGLPTGVDLLKIDVPFHATTETSYRWTRASRHKYYYPIARPRQNLHDPSPLLFEERIDAKTLEIDSDIRAVCIDQVISVTPLHNDLTARVNGEAFKGW